MVTVVAYTTVDDNASSTSTNAHVQGLRTPRAQLRRFLHLMNKRHLLWLPRLGPSAAWAYRRLTSGLAAQPDGYVIALAELGHWLGVGPGCGRHSVMVRTLRRLVTFHLALQVDAATLAVRRRVPPLTRPQLERLSVHLQRTHRQLITPPPAAEAS